MTGPASRPNRSARTSFRATPRRSRPHAPSRTSDPAGRACCRRRDAGAATPPARRARIRCARAALPAVPTRARRAETGCHRHAQSSPAPRGRVPPSICRQQPLPHSPDPVDPARSCRPHLSRRSRARSKARAILHRVGRPRSRQSEPLPIAPAACGAQPPSRYQPTAGRRDKRGAATDHGALEQGFEVVQQPISLLRRSVPRRAAQYVRESAKHRRTTLSSAPTAGQCCHRDPRLHSRRRSTSDGRLP